MIIIRKDNYYDDISNNNYNDFIINSITFIIRWNGWPTLTEHSELS